MIKVFFGTDRKSIRDAAVVAQIQAGMHPTTIDETNFSPGIITTAAGTTSLFGTHEIYILDTPSSSLDFYEEVKNNLKILASSPNTFMVLENTLLVDDKRRYEKHAQSTEEFLADKAQSFDGFGLADALASKDKKKLWVLLQRANYAGQPTEKIIGLLWWQLKSLKLAKLTSTATEAGMKDYPYKKAKAALNKFKPGEVEKLSRDLLELYHDNHQGRRELDLALEAWALQL